MIKRFIEFIQEKKDDPCWDGYEQYGTKKKDGKEVPNCVPEEKEELEESDAPTTTTAGMAGVDNPVQFKKSKFAGYPCIEVDDDTYMKCSQGKRKFARWRKYVEEEELEKYVKKNFHKEKKLLLKNSKTGSMVFIK